MQTLLAALPGPFETVVLLVVAAYLIGSIPTAVWVGRLGFGRDIRNEGSGNAGSTNTYRVLGFWPGMVVQVVDILKGVAAALLPLWPGLLSASEPDQQATLQLLCGVSAVLGHIWPVLAGFRGGKGMNTLLGMMLTVFPLVGLGAIGVFAVVLLWRHMVSLASMVAAWTLPVYALLLYRTPSPPSGLLVAISLTVPLLVLYTHRSNVQRIRTGTESTVGFLARRKNI